MKKELTKKKSLFGKLTNKIKKILKGKNEFTTSGNYWEKRYQSGKNSGPGSYNNLAIFKGEVLNDFIKKNNISSVIEFGSGDGNQLYYYEPKSYIGFDISETAVKLSSELFKDDSSKQFRLMSSYNNDKADLTLSLDVIYHLVEDDVFSDYMKRLFNASNNWVIIYSTNDDNHERNSINKHVRHRNFTKWVESNISNFELTEHIPNKYPFNGDRNVSSYADFFIFRKK